MTIIQDIKLDPATGVLYEPTDWQSNGGVYFHLPTHIGFEILPPEGKKAFRTCELVARLVHVCPGKIPPPNLVDLGRAAIVVCLEEIGWLDGWTIEEVK
jgi:hypothetical protein